MRNAALACSALLMFTATGGAQVAITEFLTDADGADRGREWLELFNYGAEPVNLDGWTLADEGTDVVALPAVIMEPGGFLVLVSGGIGLLPPDTAKAVFETEWLGGRAEERVVGIEGMALANFADELILRDANAVLVWSLAYADDDVPARSTFKTETHDFAVKVFGSAADPGVVRDGFDNGQEGFLGYQSNDVTTDEFAYASDISQLVALFGKDFANVTASSVGSPLLGAYRAQASADLDGDGMVSTSDLFMLLAAWGPCPAPPLTCPADLDLNGEVGTTDLLLLLSDWG